MLTNWPHRLTAAAVLIVASTAIGQEPVFIGLVREDGYLIPVAAVTPKLFETPITVETLVNGEPLPPPAPDWPFKSLAWTLSYGRGRKPVEITTLEQVTVPMPYCADRLGWRTTLRLPPAPKNVAPIRKIGIAVRGAAVEHPEDVVSQPDAASRRVSGHIVRLTHAKEAELISSYRPSYFPPGDRTKIAVQLTKLQRHRTGAISTYYFEATKAWGLAIDNGLVTGWIVDSPKGLLEHDVEYKINDDTYKQNDHAQVWGIVRYQDKTLWFLEWHGWESEYYTLHDWPSGITLLTVNAYDC